MKGNGKDDYIIVLTLRSGGLPSVGGECDLCLRSRDSERSSRELLLVPGRVPLLSFNDLYLAYPRISPQNTALSAPYTHPVRGPLAYVKDQLGHSSISMTVDVYGHLVPGANRAAMDRLPTVEDPVSSDTVERKAQHS